eukprot:m.81271 g.81271  ORF g.81271 m.81271 type:complete len:470 (+) comp25402_c0_seq1:53-1462(+)
MFAMRRVCGVSKVVVCRQPVLQVIRSFGRCSTKPTLWSTPFTGRLGVCTLRSQGVNIINKISKPMVKNLTTTSSHAVSNGAAAVTANAVAASARKALGAWMVGVSAAVFGMVAVGGYTRLTRSGLSMTEWRLTGSKLPSTVDEWTIEFDKYKRTPEYNKLNMGMTLEEFKSIYFWEWFHRMWGRSLGVLFAVPAAIFVLRKPTRQAIASGGLYPRLALLFTLGGTQGLIGWWMVKSGLDHTHVFGIERDELDMPRVSPYRLATHLIFAFVTYGLLAWTSMDLLANTQARKSFIDKTFSQLDAKSVNRLQKFRRGVIGTCVVLGITVFSGAFVAGNLAGLAYSDWPLMGGKIIPDGIKDGWNFYSPRFRNVFENAALVQFDHRILAYTSVACATTVALMAKRLQTMLPKSAVFRSNLLLVVLFTQASLGVATIVYNVPTELGVLHQTGALTAWTVSLWLLHSVKVVRKVV